MLGELLGPVFDDLGLHQRPKGSPGDAKEMAAHLAGSAEEEEKKVFNMVLSMTACRQSGCWSSS